MGELSGQAVNNGAAGAFQTQEFDSFLIANQEFQITENSNRGSVLGSFNVNVEASFEMFTNFDSDNDQVPAFTISGNQLILNDPGDLDYESQTSIEVSFVSTLSSNGKRYGATILINIIDDTSEDTDGDGLTQEQEASYGTSDLIADTDNDGFDDGSEVASGTDPNDKSSKPESNDIPINPFRVTTFTYNQENGDLDITWSTNKGDIYGLQYSTDLETWVDWTWTQPGHPQEGEVIALEAGGDEFTFALGGALNPFGPQGANLPSIYVRAVKKN